MGSHPEGVEPVNRSLRPADLDRLPEAARTQIRTVLAQLAEVRKGDRTPAAPTPEPANPMPPAPGTQPPGGESEAPPSLLTRLWYWVTEEAPPEAPRRFVAVESPDARRRFVTGPAGPKPGPTEAVDRAADLPGASGSPGENRWGRRGIGLWIVEHPWAASSVIVGFLALAMVGTVAGKLTGNVPPLAGPQAAAIVRSDNAAGKPTNQSTTPSNPAPGQPDCARVKVGMQPVGVSTHQPVPGLCYTLGDGHTTWVIGCAPGFQTACDPALKPVISCVGKVGARQSSALTEAEVLACAVAQGGAGGGGPGG